MSTEDLQRLIRSDTELNGNTFAVLRQLSHLRNSVSHNDNMLARDLTIRLLEHRERLDPAYQPLFVDLVRAQGLYPYLKPEDFESVSDRIAYESFRPDGLGDSDIVFHRTQAAVYNRLLDGENVILSAPTSFGKSLIIDGLLASRQYTNVVLVVPTLALIDETRRRITRRFGSEFKVITHPSQTPGQRNVFVYTQERVLEQTTWPPNLDLFVIDEFYKLGARDDRGWLLNQALYQLLKLGSQFYFLGPSIDQIAGSLPARLNAHFIQTDFSTVAIDVHRVRLNGRDRLTALVDLCRSLEGQTLIYCTSPAETRRVAGALVEAGISHPAEETVKAADWIARNYDPEWLFGTALRLGVGIHNARIPRSLSQFVVRSFDAGNVRFLVCTSTLIEGVNTAAKNVVIYSNRIGRLQLDFFTYNNIRGRTGRMFRHFVGNVYLFHDAPTADLPIVDFPVFTQEGDTPPSLLVQLDDGDLTQPSRDRLSPVKAQDALSLDTIKENAGIDPELQVSLARRLARDRSLLRLLGWTGLPPYEGLVALCNEAWLLSGFSGRHWGVASGRQLAFRLSRLSQNPEPRDYIRELGFESAGDERVESALEFVRQWPGHHAPRLFAAVERIQREVSRRLGQRPGSYAFYIGRVQNLFLPRFVGTLEEFGLPVQVGILLARWGVLDADLDLDQVLAALRALDPAGLSLSPFERELLIDLQETL